MFLTVCLQPVSAVDMGIDAIQSAIEQLATNASPSHVESCLNSIKSSIADMKNVNVFMLMTINRCMDYTKV